MTTAPEEAVRFLKSLDPEATSFTFQTFDDVEIEVDGKVTKRKDQKLVRVLNGTLEQHTAELARLNAQGAGIYVTVNETNLEGRKKANIVRVRAVFVDLDGSPLDPVMADKRRPHMVIETSPRKWHAYWRVADMPLDQFEPVQEALIAKFHSDKNVHDLPRVMRLPGFMHRKREPFLIKIESTNDHAPFSAADFPQQTKPSEPDAPVHIRNAEGSGRGLANPNKPATLDDVKSALKHVPAEDYGIWFQVGAALRREFGEAARATFHEWSRTSKKYDAKLCDAEWNKVAPYDKYTSATIFYYADEHSPGWRDNKPEPKAEEAQPKTDSGAGFSVTPYVPRDPGLIPPRHWLYHPHYVKQFASVTVAQSGVGKSSLMISEALAMVSGKPLLKVQPEGKLRVWYWNGEDPPDELERRFAATTKHFGLTAEDIGDRLFFSSGDEMPIVIADGTRFGARVAEPVVEKIVATIIENKLDVLWIDPFVSCHTVDENNNSGIDTVAKRWASIAKETNCSIMLVHHARKIGAGGVVTADDARGASALNAAGRMTRTLNKMTEREGDDAEIDGQLRWRYFRIDDGKNNLAPPEVAVWCQLVSVPLGNDKGGWLGTGDNVGVVGPWTFPKAEKRQHSSVDILRVQEVIRKGGPWREHQLSKAEPWVGIPIADVLGYDLARRPEKKAVVALIEGWLKLKLLKRIDGKDKRSEAHTYIEVGDRPGVEEPRASDDA